MPTYAKQPLSAGTHGVPIKVTTAAPIDGSDTTIHQAVNSTTDRDLITLYAYNDDTVTRTLHIGWGGTTDPDSLIIMDIPPQAGLTLVTWKRMLRNNLTVVASASAANVITIHGEVDQIRA
jgi:hypothetical protein